MKPLSLAIILIGFIKIVGLAQMTFIEDAEKGTLTIHDGRSDVLTYCFGNQLKPGVDSKYAQSCYIHPLFSLDGRVLTDDSPADHLHHHGVFWTWPVVKTRGQTTQTWSPAVPSLRQHLVRWLERRAEAGQAVLSVENAWKLDDREIVAREVVTLRVQPADRLGRAIDLEIKIEPVGGPLELQGTPDQNKGYGGLSLRGAPMFTGSTMTTDKGVLQQDVVNTPFRWADLSTKKAGVAIFVSTKHPGFPTAWLIRNSYGGVLNVSWPGLKPVVLQPGRPVTLSYRLYIHRGDAVTGAVQHSYQRYLNHE